jgi:hypothetical protein
MAFPFEPFRLSGSDDGTAMKLLVVYGGDDQYHQHE